MMQQPGASDPTSDAILIRGARVVTPVRAAEVPRGIAMGQLQILPAADVLVQSGVIAAVGQAPAPPGARIVEADGRVLLPGLIDCHTHLCWVGSRLDEWEQKLGGATYLDILRQGGGIMATVRSVRAASEADLSQSVRLRLESLLKLGTTTVEIKSGYGLSTHDELKMLRAIRAAASTWPGTVVPTALLGHAIDESGQGGREGFVARTVTETLPAVHAEFPGIAIDAFCEDGAWTLDETLQLMHAAHGLGHPIRVHADQFNSQGVVEAAITLGAVSVDHLEASEPDTLSALARSATIGVGLPGCGLHLGCSAAGSKPLFANLRFLIDEGGAAAVASNCNPGSAPVFSMPLALAMAVRGCGLSPREAITAGTLAPAWVLGLHDRGTIEVGARADLVLLNSRDERDLVFQLGGNPFDQVIVGGRLVSPRAL